MKKLLLILLLFVTFGALAQTYDTLPTGSKPYGNFYLGVYFGETDHVIPWQTDHLNCWRTSAADAIGMMSKVMI